MLPVKQSDDVVTGEKGRHLLSLLAISVGSLRLDGYRQLSRANPVYRQ